MALDEIYSNEYGKVEVNLENKSIQVTWLQHTSGAPLRAVLEEALRHARADRLNRWLFDMRKINYTTVADQSWTAKEFFPSFDHRLHHRLACVASPENLDMLPAALILDSIRENPLLVGSIELQMFLNLEMAQYWLLL